MWTIKFKEDCQKEFNKLDYVVQQRIIRYLHERVKPEPKRIGEPLAGDMKGFWRYRVGDYRIIAKLYDGELMLLAVRVAKRADVYKKPL
jgi:mRNA interferase RelE/StbE